MKEKKINKWMLRFIQGRHQHSENESERADAVTGLQSEEQQLIIDAM